MAREEQFDSFYHATRRAMVHQAFALTGDLGAAQSAVRDAYVAAWHHWRKASAFADPQDWVRPRAWQLVQRRHTTRLWHRTKGMATEHKAVLDAVANLSMVQRRVLLLTQLARLPLADAARELNLPQGLTLQHLRSATAGFAADLDVDPASIPDLLDSLAVAADATSLPRVSIIRRAGRRRRRSHTLVAAASAAFLSVAAGAFAYQPSAVEAIDEHRLVGPPEPATAAAPAENDKLPTAEDMLGGRQIAHLTGGGRWRITATNDNTSGSGIHTICQESRFADPDGLSAVVRTFQAVGERRTTAVQTLEVSKSSGQAEEAYATMVGWYAGCEIEQVQLLRAYAVDGVGDRATVLTLHAWKRPVASYTVAVAQVGQVVTSMVIKLPGQEQPKPGHVVRTIASAASMVCERTGSDSCTGKPSYAASAPPPSGREKGILSSVDLPPVGRLGIPWIGTSPQGGADNDAATTCDRANFAKEGAVRTRTRTFVIPKSRLPKEFGLIETYGVFPSAKAAGRFLEDIRDNVAGCEDRDLATEVVDADSVNPDDLEVTTWDLETEVDADNTIRFRTGFVRAGRSVAQLTFTPAEGADMGSDEFRSLVVRAGQRLRELE